MGKKANQKVISAASAAAAAKGPATSTKSESKLTADDRKPSIMDTVDVLLQQLEQLTITNPFDKEEEKEIILKQLFHEYKQISMKNKVDSKREELLTQEILALDRRNDETQQELNDLKENCHAADSKIEKLENLSQVLNYRIKTVETKAAEDIKAEKADRLKMSYEFSEKIKDISNKLDALGKKREQIMTENQRLKQVLKQCLDDYDREQQLEKEAQAKMVKELGEVLDEPLPAVATTTEPSVEEQQEPPTVTNEDGSGTPIIAANETESKDESKDVTTSEPPTSVAPPAPPSAVTVVMNAILSGNPEDIARALMNDKDLIQLEAKLKDESHLMEVEDTLSRLADYRSQENDLRQKVNTYMELFDQFQIRLTNSNNLFKLKQLKVEEITKDIKQLEKMNQELKIRMNDCHQTTNTMIDNIHRIDAEKEKLMKIMDKQRSLIEKFSTDCTIMEQFIEEKFPAKK